MGADKHCAASGRALQAKCNLWKKWPFKRASNKTASHKKASTK